MRQGSWKLILNGRLGPSEEEALKKEDAVFLANLAEDPAERTNLRSKYPDKVKELTELIEKWKSDVTRP